MKTHVEKKELRTPGANRYHLNLCGLKPLLCKGSLLLQHNQAKTAFIKLHLKQCFIYWKLQWIQKAEEDNTDFFSIFQ